MSKNEIQNDYDFYAYTRPLGRKLFDLQMEWILSRSDWTLFTATATFRGLQLVENSSGMRRRTISEYNNRVLPKFKKRLRRSKDFWHKVVPIEDLIQYEYEQGSYFKPVPKSNATSPHI